MVACCDEESSSPVGAPRDQTMEEDACENKQLISFKKAALSSWTPLKDDTTPTTKKMCFRSATVAHNREAVTVSAEFIEAVRRDAPVAIDIYTEEPFPDGTRFDICLEWNFNGQHYMAIIESKMKNVLHGLGQVLHYRGFLQTHPGVRVISIVAVEKEYEGFHQRYATLRSYGVHVWWPGKDLASILEFNV